MRHPHLGVASNMHADAKMANQSSWSSLTQARSSGLVPKVRRASPTVSLQTFIVKVSPADS